MFRALMKRLHFFVLLAIAVVVGTGYWLGRARFAVEAAGANSEAGRSARMSVTKAARDLEKLPKPVADFARWAETFLADQKAHQLEEGIAFAEAHRVVMKELIQSDPRRAIESAVPMVVRQKLPPEIVARLEERVQLTADIEVLAVSEDAALGEPRVRRFTRADGREWRTFVYGRRAEQQTLTQAAVNGVAVDGMLALSESPLRVLEIGEVPPAGVLRVEKCPVSGKSTAVEEPASAVTEEQVVVQVGKQMVYLCDGGHIRLFEEELVAGEGGTGGTTGISAPAATSFSNGPRALLYMRLAYADDRLEPQTEAAAWDNIRQLNSYFQEVSYGKIFYLAAVPPLIILPKTKAWYVQDYNTNGGSNGLIMNDAKDVARRMGYNPDNYQHYTVIYSSGPGSFGGLGSVGGSNVWLKSTSLGVFAHEIGHNVGLWHGNSWNTSNRDVIGGGGNSEYGNSYDVLGSSGSVTGNKGHFMSPHKNQMNWLSTAYVSTVNTSGLYRIFPMDQTILDTTRRYALKIAKDTDRDYWVEFRQKYNADYRWFKDGVVLNWSPWGQSLDSSVVGSNSGGQFLDTTPGSADGKNDGPVVIGRTFSDRESSIHITPVGKGGTTPESMDVMVNVGDFPTNNAPVINTLSADTTTPAVNGTVNFTVDATDVDGDTLAYFWDFGDATYGTNSATTAKQFTTARHHAVRCVVSDMKGGEVSKLMLITVGSPTTFTAAGRVLDGGSNPVREVRIQNGSTGTGFRGAWTDSNGDFIVTNLATGSVTLTPVLGGFTFSPANAVLTLGPNATGVDFTATESVRVTVEATDAEATEAGGDGGTIHLTRTGSTTAALTVYADLQGDAALGSDYSLNPAALTTLSPIESFSIPAGSATLDIALSTVNDTTREGPERLRFILIPHATYTIAGKAAAEVVITDTGTNNVANRVTVFAVEEDADEAGGTGTFEIRRSGPTTDALSVTFTLAGAASTTAAVNGSDYSLLSSPIIIPAGEASVLVTVSPVNDAAVEGQETVQLTISTSTLYGVGVPSSAIVRLADDDIPAVSITATDATGTEGGTDLGLFTISRTGDTSAALVVDYTIGGTALHGTDYVALPGTLAIPAGAASAAIPIVPIDDNQGEPAQTVILQLRNDPRLLLSSNLATVTINDNDLPVVAIGVSDSLCNEPNATGSFRITTTGTGAGNITVRYTISGTATSGADFTALTGTLSIAKNTTGTITVTPIEDAIFEDAETVIVTLTPDPAYLVDVLQSSSTLTIRDNESASTVNVSFTTASMSENGGISKLWFSRTGSTGSASTAGALTVNYSVSGSATAGTDCTALAGSVVIPDLASGVEVAVTGINDTVAEGTETLIVTLTSGSYSIERAAASLLITDDETSGFARTASFGTRRTVMTEGDAATSIPVTLSAADPVNAITVEYIIDTNSATGSGVDTSLVASTLVFAPGEVQQLIPVSVTDDFLPEKEEHLTLKLNAVNGASLSNSGNFHTLFIRDNEPRITIESTDAIAYEATADTASFTLTRTGPVTGTLAVSLTATGTATTVTDYSGFTTTLTFAAGQRRLTQSLTAITDALAEGAESILITVQPSTRYSISGTGAATMTLLDSGTDHPPSVRFIKPMRAEVALPSGCGVLLDAEISDDGAPGSATLAWAMQSGPGTVTFGSTSSAQTTAIFSAAGRYILRCTATDSSLQTSFAEVAVVVRAGASLWAGQDIGITGTNATGADDVRSDLVQNQAAGSSITSTSDSFRLTSTELSGDGEITARFEGIDGAFSSARSGLMIRESTAANARYAALTFSGTSSLNWNTRASAGGTPTATSSSVTPGPRWLRVTRSGNIFAGFHSTDGVNWTQVGSNTTLTMAANVNAGIAMTSASSTRPARALFSQVRVTGTPGNSAALSDAAPASTIASAAFKQLDATITDDAATESPLITTWTQLSGPGTATFTDAANPDTTAQFSAPGDYVLRLSADDGEVTSFEDVTVQVQFAALSFGAGVPAQEQGNVPGSLTLTRTSATDMPLTISYAASGSALAPADYATLAGSAVFPAGQSSTALTIAPQSDALAEGDEAVQITLVSGTGYTLPGVVTSAVTVQDLPIDAWRFQQFGAEANNPAIAGDAADNDQDGIVLLLEYALALDPDGASQDGLPKPEHSGGLCHIVYTRPVSASDVTYTVEWSIALTDWSSAGVTQQVIGTAGGVQTLRASVTPPGGEARCFMRVRVTRP